MVRVSALMLLTGSQR